MKNKISHLGMIQNIINRMAKNSFAMKGWSVVLVSALFALAAKDADVLFVCLGYFPTIVFWGLDGYYLRQEILFRKLYDNVRTKSETEIDFSMDTRQFNTEVKNWFCTMISKTLLPFYLTILSSVSIILLINKLGGQ